MKTEGKLTLLSQLWAFKLCFPQWKGSLSCDSLQDPFSHDRTTSMSDKVYLESLCWTGTKTGEEIKFWRDLNLQPRSRDSQEKQFCMCWSEDITQVFFLLAACGSTGLNSGSGKAWEETLFSMNHLVSPKNTFKSVFLITISESPLQRLLCLMLILN